MSTIKLYCIYYTFCSSRYEDLIKESSKFLLQLLSTAFLGDITADIFICDLRVRAAVNFSLMQALQPTAHARNNCANNYISHHSIMGVSKKSVELKLETRKIESFLGAMLTMSINLSGE